MSRFFIFICFLPLMLASGCFASIAHQPDPENIEKVMSVAREMTGKPYRYGGTSPSGFDCSGLVNYVYKTALGVKLPRTSQGLYNRSRPVPLGEEKPADLIFFKEDGIHITHVGIYAGKGKFIHAASSGKVVRQSGANERYWKKRFAGVRRLLR